MTSFTLHVPNSITKWKTKFSCQVIRNKLRVQGRNKQTLRADSRGSCSPVAHFLSSSPAFCARTAALLHWISRGRCTRQRTLEHTVMFKYTYTHMFRYTFTHVQVGIHTHVQVYIHTFGYMYIHVQASTHVQVHTHMHAGTLSCASLMGTGSCYVGPEFTVLGPQSLPCWDTGVHHDTQSHSISRPR